MNKQYAEKVITEYLKPIFGFALKRCKNVQDAEDLSQEIILKAYRTLISRDDIEQPDKFIWTIAHNALSNYYRDTSRQVIGIPFDDVEDFIGHAPGGVCPFGIKEGIPVYLDESLKKFDTVYPAAGNDHSAVRLTIAELEAVAGAEKWVDVCK